MQNDVHQCCIKIPVDLLNKATDAGLLVRTQDGRYYGLTRIAIGALEDKLKVVSRDTGTTV